MSTLYKWTTKIIAVLMGTGMCLGFLGLILAVLLQVFARVALPKVPSWTEEVSRFFLIWMVCCGAGLAMRAKGYVNVDLVITLLPKRVQLVMATLSDLLIAFFMSVFLYYSIAHLRLGLRQTSPALEISMWWVFIAFVVMGGGVVLFALISFIGNLYQVITNRDLNAPERGETA